jgi:hypothetical protein
VREHRPASPLFLLAVATGIATLGAATTRISSAPSSAQTVKPDTERAAHMQVHFSQVMTALEAIIRGDLAAVREPATWLAAHDVPRSLPAAAAPYLAEMRRAARRTAQATTILEAALGTADMLRTCGDCHRGLGTRPAVTMARGPDVGGIVGHMLAHQRAADEMLQGLTVPSSTSWRAGTDGFAVAPLRSRTLPDDPKLTPELAASEKRIHEMANQAAKADDSHARAVFYGQIIARCADCHAVHRTVWGPTRR